MMAELVPGRNLVTTPDNDGPDTLVSGLFVFLGVIMDKVFKTYSEQRDILRRRGLIIEHPRFFTNALQHDDYYNIINGYKKYFIASLCPERYIHGTTFEQICALYEFDQSLRDLILPALIRIEKHIKSITAYSFSEAYGYDHHQYLNPENFNNDSSKNKGCVKYFV